jgi:hypothetical protein
MHFGSRWYFINTITIFWHFIMITATVILSFWAINFSHLPCINTAFLNTFCNARISNLLGIRVFRGEQKRHYHSLGSFTTSFIVSVHKPPKVFRRSLFLTLHYYFFNFTLLLIFQWDSCVLILGSDIYFI